MSSAALRPNLLIDALRDAGMSVLSRRAPQLSTQQAGLVMAEISEALCSRFGRRDMYLPSREALRRAARNQDIRAAYEQAGPDATPARSTARVQQIADHHGLSPRRVRAILAAVG